MKLLSLSITAIALATASVFAQPLAPVPVPAPVSPGVQIVPPAAVAPPATTTATAGAKPKIFCAAPLFEFGNKNNAESVKHTFTVKNNGEGVLNISNVKPACGCTIANISSKVLQPGESATIDANLSLKGRRGLQTKTITVNSNDPTTPAFRLTLKGTAVSAVNLSPTSVYVGNLGQGESATKTVTISNNDTNALNITSVKAQNNSVTLNLKTIEEGQKYELDVTTSGTLPIGRISDFITITTDNPKAKSERVTVYGQVVGKLNVAPAKLDLVAAPGFKKRYAINVRPGSVKNYQITAALWPAALDATVKILNRGAAGFSVEFSNVDTTTALNGSTIIINTNLADYPIIEVPVTVKSR